MSLLYDNTDKSCIKNMLADGMMWCQCSDIGWRHGVTLSRRLGICWMTFLTWKCCKNFVAGWLLHFHCLFLYNISTS